MSSSNRIQYDYFDMKSINLTNYIDRNIYNFALNSNDYKYDNFDNFSDKKSNHILFKLKRYTRIIVNLYINLIKDNILFAIINVIGFFMFVLIVFVLYLRR